MDSLQRTYNMSDADLCMFTSNLVILNSDEVWDEA
jgi:hypothetical protein